MSSYKDFNTPLDQKKLLDECIFVVKEQSFYMKQSLENGSLRDTLKYASNMLCELRTSLLSPKYYYELYMLIFNELQHLDSFISDKKKHKKKFIDIYESVQHAGNIIPRLYLLIIVGRNYIKNKDIKAKYILKDMTELCKGIQHPLKGLFLRYFLIQMCKDRIPDTGSEYEEAGGGNIDDAFDFLLTNFYESLKLWSRMNDKTVKTLRSDDIINNRKNKLKEKMDVKMLIGSILVRMSQLEGMTVSYYIEKCLPQILLYLSNINDVMIQQYIFESIVQVFSDECHINSLEILLNALLKMNSSLDFKSILITLLKRLRSFIESNKYELPKNVEFFSLFYNNLILCVDNTLLFNNNYNTNNNNVNDNTVNNSNNNNNNISVNNEEYNNNIAKMLQVIYEFLYLYVKINNDISYINKIFILPLKLLEKTDANNEIIYEKVNSIIVVPFKYIGLNILKCENMNILLNLINDEYRKKLSLDIIDAVIECKNKTIIYHDIENILNYISIIFYEKTKKEEDIFNLENNPIYTCEKICKFFHLITNTKDIDERYNTIMLFYNYIHNSCYIIHILPTIIFSMLDLVTKIINLETHMDNSYYEKKEDSSIYEDNIKYEDNYPKNHIIDEKKISQYNSYVKNIFKFIHTNLITISNKSPMITFKLFLYSAIVVNNYNHFLKKHPYISLDNLEPICYEFITQPLIIYEEDINVSSQQYECIILAVGILSSYITILQNENYENIALKLTQHANKLLKKKEQCLALLQCSHLYWNNEKYRNSQKVFECLQKSIKNADISIQSNPKNMCIFLYMLNKYLYYYEENVEITYEHINNLINVCQDYYNDSNCDDDFKNEFKQIVNYILIKKKNSNSFNKIIVNSL